MNSPDSASTMRSRCAIARGRYARSSPVRLSAFIGACGIPRPSAGATTRRFRRSKKRLRRSEPASGSSSKRSTEYPPRGRRKVPDELVNVRYMVDDVEKAVAFYTDHFGFTARTNAAPAFADVVRGHLRLLLSGPKSSAGRPMPDGRTPEAGGWNRIHFIVEDIAADVERLRAAGVTFRNDIISGPGGQQILLEDPAGNPIELFQPAGT